MPGTRSRAALAMGGAAAALGMEARDWALSNPASGPIFAASISAARPLIPLSDPVTQLVFGGGRDMVSDVWVAGRQLLSDGNIDPLGLGRAWRRAPDAWAERMNNGG